MKKLKYITILRALAILSVVIVHTKLQSSGINHFHPYLTDLLNSGVHGVQLFYLLSAFTLFNSFNYRSKKENNLLRNYFLRRFFRIAPLFYLAILYYLWQDGYGARYWLGDAKTISPANIISNFTFLHGFSPYWINSIVPGGWSVAIETAFYCMLPFLAFKLKSFQQAFCFLLICVGIRALLFLYFNHHCLISDSQLWTGYLFFYLPNQLPVFALGILLYFFIRDEGKIQLTSKILFTASCVLILGLVIQRSFIIYDLLFYGISFFILAVSLKQFQPKMLFNKAMLYIGKVSYTIYLTHWASIYFLQKFKLLNILPSYNQLLAVLNLGLNYILILGGSLILSTALYHTFESPMQHLGERLIKKLSANQSA